MGHKIDRPTIIAVGLLSIMFVVFFSLSSSLQSNDSLSELELVTPAYGAAHLVGEYTDPNPYVGVAPSFTASPFANDFVVTGAEGGASGDEHYFPSNGDGTFGAKSNINGIGVADGPDVADMDGDGDNDFLICDGTAGISPNRGVVFLYTNNGGGSFTQTQVASGITNNNFCTYLRIGDFNEDGKNDFVVGDNRNFNGVHVFLQTTPGTFAEQPALDTSWTNTGNNLFGVAVGDLNGDTHLDILLLGYFGTGSGQMRFYEGNALGGFASPTLLFNINSDFSISGTVSLTVLDLDLDGDLDILAGGGSDGAHFLYLNNGDGVFTKPAGLIFDTNAQSGMDRFDFDGDGDEDIVLATFGLKTLLYFENLGGSLASPTTIGSLLGSSIGIGAPQSLLFAEIIDFEIGFINLQSLSTVNTATNTVTFSVGNSCPGSDGFITNVGTPQTAFVPNDTPSGGNPGSFFLSDENNGPNNSLNYCIEFANTVEGISLDAYDFRADGGASVGNTVTLRVFSDSFTTQVGSDTFIITSGLPDGNVVNFVVDNPTASITSAILDYGTDAGTGIDNISFTTNTAPTASDDSFKTAVDETLIVPDPGVLTNDNDPDGDTLSANIVLSTDTGTLGLSSTGGFTWTPPPTNFEGTTFFTYKANDGLADSNTATTTIDVIRPVLRFNEVPPEYTASGTDTATLTVEDETAAGEGAVNIFVTSTFDDAGGIPQTETSTVSLAESLTPGVFNNNLTPLQLCIFGTCVATPTTLPVGGFGANLEATYQSETAVGIVTALGGGVPVTNTNPVTLTPQSIEIESAAEIRVLDNSLKDNSNSDTVFATLRSETYPWGLKATLTEISDTGEFKTPNNVIFGTGNTVPGNLQVTVGETVFVSYPSATPEFFIRNEEGGFSNFGFGFAGDSVPVVGDFDNDGSDTIAVHQPSTSTFYVRNEEGGFTSFGFGFPNDSFPIAGDFDNDGTDTVGVYQPSTSVFYIRNEEGGFSNFGFGFPGDSIPIVGDFDNDGTETVGVLRSSDNTFFIRNEEGGFTSFGFGFPNDSVPLVGDFDNDGTETVAVMRAGGGTESTSGSIIAQSAPLVGTFEGSEISATCVNAVNLDGVCEEWIAGTQGALSISINSVFDLPCDTADTGVAGINDSDCPTEGAVDVFLEVDWADAANPPSPTAIQNVVDALRAAPYNNPNGDTGINLHVQIDEACGPLTGIRLSPLTVGSEPTLQDVKNACFGTATDRAAGAAVLANKAQVFRWVWFGTFAVENPNSSGAGEDGGNDLFVARTALTNQLGSISDLESVLIHELGHTFDLDHGPIVNYQPNYVSVMNYDFQFPNTNIGTVASPNIQSTGRPLAFSYEAFPTIQESNLNENNGILEASPANFATVKAVVGGVAIPAQVVNIGTSASPVAVNFNNDVDSTDTGLSQSIHTRTLPGGSDAVIRDLVGQDDRNEMTFNFRTSGAFIFGGTGSNILISIIDTPPPPPDPDPVVETNTAPVITSITAPLVPQQINTEISLTVDFTDPDTIDSHTVTVDWNDGTTSEVSVGTNDPKTATLVHTYTVAGIFIPTVTVTDAFDQSDTGTFTFITIFDPEGGFVTGGGWIQSPLGADTANENAEGKATFGFVSKYKKGLQLAGQTQFHFKAGDLKFKSSEYDPLSLVIAGAKAVYKGTGTINGAGEFKFILFAIDADVNPDDSHIVDKFRIKIFTEDEFDVETIRYDNQMGALENADPTTELSGGSIQIHSPK